MKTSFYIILGVLFIFTACSHRKKETFNFDSLALCEGDIVFRKGIGHKSNFVLHADTGGIYSHIGIIVKKDSSFMVVHLTPGEAENENAEDTIKMETLANFFSPKKASAGSIMRLKDYYPGISAANYAIKLLDKKILFDHDYSLNDSSKMYCTELVWHAYLSAGIDISEERRSILKGYPLFSGTYIFPSDIFKNKNLIFVYNY